VLVQPPPSPDDNSVCHAPRSRYGRRGYPRPVAHAPGNVAGKQLSQGSLSPLSPWRDSVRRSWHGRVSMDAHPLRIPQAPRGPCLEINKDLLRRVLSIQQGVDVLLIDGVLVQVPAAVAADIHDGCVDYGPCLRTQAHRVVFEERSVVLAQPRSPLPMGGRHGRGATRGPSLTLRVVTRTPTPLIAAQPRAAAAWSHLRQDVPL